MGVSVKENGAFAVCILNSVLIKHDTNIRNIKKNEEKKFQEVLTPIFNEIVEEIKQLESIK